MAVYNQPLQKIDTTGYTAAAKRLVEEVQKLSIIPPKNGSTYSLSKVRYNISDTESLSLTELQANLANILAEEPDIPLWQAYIRSGYEVASYFNEAKNVKRIQAHLTGMCKSKLTPTLTKFINYLKLGPAEELLIDKTWLLNEQVGLYEECKRNKMYTQAVRLLNDISMHVDVDSRVSSKLEVVETVDYAALLGKADERINSIPAPEDTDRTDGTSSSEIIEGEFLEVETPVAH